MKVPKFSDLKLYEDEDFVVVNKPAFLSSLDDRNGDTINMLKLARQEYDDIQIAHRLDRETSGALVFAKNPESYRAISMQFEHREVTKIYHAIVDGQHQFNDLLVDLPIAIGSKGQVKIDKALGKAAETIFNTLELFRHYSLVECRPKTGRMHQIRIHLATQRASITGDDMYGGKPLFLSKIKRHYKLAKDTDELPVLKRFALHARALQFKAMNGTTISVEAPYPKDFDAGLKLLLGYDR